jgi:hypothetical protein
VWCVLFGDAWWSVFFTFVMSLKVAFLLPGADVICEVTPLVVVAEVGEEVVVGLAL